MKRFFPSFLATRQVALVPADAHTLLPATDSYASELEAPLRRDIDRYRCIIALTGAKPE